MTLKSMVDQLEYHDKKISERLRKLTYSRFQVLTLLLVVEEPCALLSTINDIKYQRKLWNLSSRHKVW
jgi:hypothetical protein